MKKILTGDVWLLRRYRYWIDDYEHEYVDSRLKGETTCYRFRPIPGGRRKSEVFLTQNQFLRHNVYYQDPEEKSMGHGHKLSVIRRERDDGIAVYTASLHWVFVAQFFSFDDTSLPPEERANRALIVAHAKKIERYILGNPKFYLPPMIAAVNFDGSEKFTPFDPDFPNGILEVPFNCLWQIIDGQHRTYAMQQIFKGKRQDDFKNQMINVDIIVNAPLELRQRIFYETNSLGKSVSSNLTTVYRDNPDTVFANAVLRSLPLLSDDLFVEKEKSSISSKSDKLLLYKHIHDATINMRPGVSEDADFHFCQDFWQGLINVIQPWQMVLDGKTTPKWVRENTIAAHGVTIHAFGELGKFVGQSCQLTRKSPVDLVKKLQGVDWSKTNPDWLYRVVDENGGMLSRRHNVKLMLIYLKLKIGTPVKSFSKDEQDLEKFHIGKEIGG